MKNSFFLIFIIIFMSTGLVAENISIEAKDITLDKDNQSTIFQNNVTVQTEDKKL